VLGVRGIHYSLASVEGFVARHGLPDSQGRRCSPQGRW
jgi:hypothetical protein